MKFIPLKLDKIMQARTYTVFVLSGETKKFGIYATPCVGRTLQGVMSGKPPVRPSTFHAMHSIFGALNVELMQTVIWDLDDTIYTARLFLKQRSSGKQQIVEIDVRPSDSLALALMHKAPIFCRREVLDKVICIED